MNLQADIFLKWLDAKNPSLQNWETTQIQRCALACLNSKDKVIALTLFEPRDFNESFLERLHKRIAKGDLSECRFALYLPSFLQHKFESLASKLTALPLKTYYTSFLRIQQQGEYFSIRHRLRVINVDDSPVLLKFLKHSFEEMGFVDVVTQVSDPHLAVKVIRELKPDFVTMDIQMPGKTGVELVKDLLAVQYFPVIMISSLSMEEGSLVFEALNAGAFEYVQKPKLEDRALFAENLKNQMLCAVEPQKKSSKIQNSARASKPLASQPLINMNFSPNLIWCIGSSTGGTQALTRICTSLPHKIPPILIVQHIPPIFSKAFADSLDKLCPFKVKEAEDGEEVLPNHVYVAAGGIQMGVEVRSGRLHLVQKNMPPVNRFKPSVDFLFKEVAGLKDYTVVAGILTGMGRDGAEGLLALRQKGAKTFAQDEESSTVFGMPRVAIEMNATDHIVNLDDIADHLMKESFSKVKKVS